MVYESTCNTDLNGVASHSTVSRFTDPVDDTSVMRQVKEAVPKNTRKQTAWAIGVWKAWCSNRFRVTHEQVGDLLSMSKGDICNWMCKFILEARRVDGNEYAGDSIHQLVCALQRYLRANGN